MDTYPFRDAVEAHARGDGGAVEAFLAGLKPADTKSRIAHLANFFHGIRLRVGNEAEAVAMLDALYHERLGSDLEEYRAILLFEIAKTGHAAGHAETAASYALGAIRAAIEDLPETSPVGSNIARLSEREGIL